MEGNNLESSPPPHYGVWSPFWFLIKKKIDPKSACMQNIREKSLNKVRKPYVWKCGYSTLLFSAAYLWQYDESANYFQNYKSCVIKI